jgi:hypothetical protein
MPIKVLGVSSYNLGFWVFQCIFSCVLNHVVLKLLDSKFFLKASTTCCINMHHVACYNYDIN